MFWIINSLIGLCTPVIRRRPKGASCDESKLAEVFVRLEKGESVSEAELSDAVAAPIAWMNHRYDCADFRALKLLKLSFYSEVPEAIVFQIKKTLCDFKFWITSPGIDSMCYHSENHQLAFATAEYLTGDRWPTSVFSIDNQTGLVHKTIAQKRLKEWFHLRKRFGFSEFYSANYLPIDLAALGLLLQFAQDEEILALAKETVDQILRDYAETLFDLSFVNASGRAYPRNNMNSALNEPNSEIIIDALWGSGQPKDEYARHTAWLFTSMLFSKDAEGKPYYQLPEDLYELGKTNSPLSVDRCFGLELSSYKKEGLQKGDDPSLMMQLGSGAVTNPEVFDQTLRFIRKNHLWHNDFLSWTRFLESPLLSLFRNAGWLTGMLNPFMNGMALGRAQVRTDRTPYFKLSCAQGYQAGQSGAQKTTLAATLPGGIPVFINHPLRMDSSKEGRAQFEADRSPSYFGGYGIAPYAYSFGDTALVIYRLPLFRRPFAPFKMLHFTHAFFPTEWMDEYFVQGRFAFGRVKDSYIALIGKNLLQFKAFDANIAKSACGKLTDDTKAFDLIQEGRNTFWILTLSSIEKESFEDFKNRIMEKEISFDGGRLSFGEYSITYHKTKA